MQISGFHLFGRPPTLRSFLSFPDFFLTKPGPTLPAPNSHVLNVHLGETRDSRPPSQADFRCPLRHRHTKSRGHIAHCSQKLHHIYQHMHSYISISGEMGGQVGELTVLPSKGPDFSSQDQHGVSQPSITPVPQDLMHTSGLGGHQAHHGT